MSASFLRFFSFSAALVLGAAQGHSSAVLLGEIEQELGAVRRQAIEARVMPLEAVLRSTFRALPKREGYVGAAAARYALHRLFVEHKGWFVKGMQDLDPTGSASNSTSLTHVLQDQVSAVVKQLFDQRLQERGLALGELAVLAAMLEDLVHREAMGRVAAAFKAQRVPLVGRVSVDHVSKMLDYVMMSYILEIASLEGTDLGSFSASDYLEGRLPMEEIYPNWPKTQKFLRGIQEVVAPAKRGSLSFEDLTHVVEEVNEHYGRWHDNEECLDMKNTLLDMAGQCPGRVDLVRFYSSSLYEDKWQFSESVNYLRDLGALDESRASRPSVIVSNYVLGASNCIGTSRFYAQCCVDPCDSYMAKLEKAIAAPTASPSNLAAAVAATLPSLSDAKLLRRRLDAIARENHGQVPLHGRLLAQWLHHAYPTECPAPPAAGAPLRQELPRDFTVRTGEDYIATEATMRHYAPKKVTSEVADSTCELPWTSGEELLAAEPEPEAIAASAPFLPDMHAAALAAAVAFFASLASVSWVVCHRRHATAARGPLLESEVATAPAAPDASPAV